MKLINLYLKLVAATMLLGPGANAAVPSSVTVAGSLQSELGCAGDWAPACMETHLAYDAIDDAWQRVFTIPAGSYEYKAALNDSWDINYGANATQNGANILLGLAGATDVKFYYDDKTHWITDNVNSLIATVPGSFQSELGCPGDWQPDCLRSWLEDPDGDGTYSFSALIPAGSYEAKVTLDESWALNYGIGGVQNGANIPFTSDGLLCSFFSFDGASKVLTIVQAACETPPPSAVTVVGSLQSELGCPGDWQPECGATGLAYDASDQVWQRVLSVPAGAFEYKAALNGTWDVNYGMNATLGGANIPLSLASATDVKFYFDDRTHWITDNVNSPIATVPGSFQSELGCPGDWQPDCLRSWLEDPDGDGTYSFSALLPAGTYEAKVALYESWDLNYGAGGEQNGANIAFSSDGTLCSFFDFSNATKLLTIGHAPCNAPAVNDMLEALHDAVTGVGPGTSLADKMALVQAYYAVPDVTSACAMLTDFVRQVRAQRGKKLAIELADELILDAEAIMTAIGCP